MKRLLLTTCMLLLALMGRAACNPQFTWASTPNASSLLNITLTNTSTFSGAPSNSWPSYTFKYGDGSGVTYASSHSYSNPGTYTVTLYMVIADSMTQAVFCSDSIQHTVTVSYPPCGATISYLINPALNGQVTFTAANPANTPGITYSWNYGDNTTGTGSPVTHTYSSSGNKLVTLTATVGGASPCTYTTSVLIYVPTSQINCSNLHAQFTTTTNPSTLTVYCNNSSTYVSGYARHFSWSFGDGGTSTSQSPAHSYATAGTYLVTLQTSWIDSFTQAVYCTDSVSHLVTFSTPPNQIYGHVLIDSNAAPSNTPDTFKVWLVQFNAATNMLAAVDSTVVSGYSGAYFQFNNKPVGYYLLKSKMLSGPTSGYGYVPTYHDSSLYWSSAITFNHAGNYTGAKIIWLKHGIITSGPGFIGGNVSLGANKGTSGAVPGMAILLRDQNGALTASATTDANGDFTMSNIPVGVYSLYPEQMNYATIPYTVTITAAQSTVSGINFHQDDAKMNIMAHTTGIGQVRTGSQNVHLYPNPAKGMVNLFWDGFTMRNGQVIVTNLTGQKVMTATITDNSGSKTLNLSQLQPGVYFVHLSSEQAETTLKLVLQ